MEQDADRGDRLADLVVELARDAAPFGLERVEEPAREATLGRLRVLALADVADHGEVVSHALHVDWHGGHLDRDDGAVFAGVLRFERRYGAARRRGPCVPRFACEIGIEIGDGHPEQLVARVPEPRRSFVVHVDEAAVAIEQLKRLARHVRHLSEKVEIEHLGERRRRLRLAREMRGGRRLDASRRRGLGRPGRERHGEAYQGSALRRAFDGERPVEQRRALAHRREPGAGGRLPGCESDAVVVDRQEQPIRPPRHVDLARHLDRHRGRRGVAGRVGERLLHHAVHVQLLLGRQSILDGNGGDPQPETVTLREVARVRPHRVREPEAEQLHRMVLADDARERLGDVRDRRARRREGGSGRFGNGPGAELEGIEQHADRRDRLADVVVQLPRDAPALALDRLEQLRRETFASRLGERALAHVARDAEQVDLAAVHEPRHADLSGKPRAVLPYRLDLDARQRSDFERRDLRRESFEGHHRADVGDRQLEEFLHAVAAHLRVRLGVAVEEAALPVEHVEPLGREVHHAAEDREVDRRRDAGPARLPRDRHARTLLPPSKTGQGNRAAEESLRWGRVGQCASPPSCDRASGD